MGPAGSGQLTKLINQLLFDINAAALGEILPMAVKMGLDPDLVGAVVNSGTGRSYASEFFVPRILRRPLHRRLSDGARLQGPGQRRRARREPLRPDAGPGRRHRHLPDGTAPQGHGEKDKGAMIQVFEELLGVQVQRAGAGQP